MTRFYTTAALARIATTSEANGRRKVKSLGIQPDAVLVRLVGSGEAEVPLFAGERMGEIVAALRPVATPIQSGIH